MVWSEEKSGVDETLLENVVRMVLHTSSPVLTSYENESLCAVETCIIEALHYQESINRPFRFDGFVKFAERNKDNFEVFVKMAVEWVIHSEKLHELQRLNAGDGPSAMVPCEDTDDKDTDIVPVDCDIDVCDSDCDTCCVSVDGSPGLSPDALFSDLVNLPVEGEDECGTQSEHRKESQCSSLKSPDPLSVSVVEGRKKKSFQITASLLLAKSDVNDPITLLPLSLQTTHDAISSHDSADINSALCGTNNAGSMLKLIKSRGHYVANDNSCPTNIAATSGSVDNGSTALLEKETVSVAIPGYFKNKLPPATEGNKSDAKLLRPGLKMSLNNQAITAMVLPSSSRLLKVQGRSLTTNSSRCHPYKMPIECRSDKRNKIFKIYREHKDLEDLLHCQTTKQFCKKKMKPFIHSNTYSLKYVNGDPVFLNYKFERTSVSEACRILGRLEEIDDEMEDIPFTADDVIHFAEKTKLAEELDRAMSELPEISII